MKIKMSQLACAFVVAVLLLYCSAAFAVPHYAVATSSTRLYLMGLQTEWNISSQGIVYKDAGGNLKTASGITGVATSGNTIFVTDSNANMVHVLELRGQQNNPEINYIRSISLGTDMIKPSAISVDARGGIYVVDGSSQSDDDGNIFTKYAYLTGNFTQQGQGVSVDISQVNNAAIRDITTYGSNNDAIIAQRYALASDLRMSYATNLNGGSVSSPDPLGEGSYFPTSIAVGKSANGNYVAYVGNQIGMGDGGSLSIIDADTHGSIGSGTIELEALMSPQDVTTFYKDGKLYVALIGDTINGQQAWLAEPDANGYISESWTMRPLGENSTSNTHQTAVSDDGQVYWFTNPQSSSIMAWSTDTWGSSLGSFTNLGDGVKYISSITFTPTAVPEPSTLASLTALFVGAIGLMRRRIR